MAEVSADIAKYVAKVKSAEQAYIEFNEKTKGDIIMSRVSHDELLDNLLVTTIVCQVSLLSCNSYDISYLPPLSKVHGWITSRALITLSHSPLFFCYLSLVLHPLSYSG